MAQPTFSELPPVPACDPLELLATPDHGEDQHVIAGGIDMAGDALLVQWGGMLMAEIGLDLQSVFQRSVSEMNVNLGGTPSLRRLEFFMPSEAICRVLLTDVDRLAEPVLIE